MQIKLINGFWTINGSRYNKANELEKIVFNNYFKREKTKINN